MHIKYKDDVLISQCPYKISNILNDKLYNFQQKQSLQENTTIATKINEEI